jgi:LmbE family N-acetylglucosaminyl deacetylase
MLKALCLHAHFDDYEFVAGGTFEMWRREPGKQFRGRVIVCTDGKAGHHFRTREETFKVRIQEQKESAERGQYECDVLRLPNGQVPREACLQISTEFLAAMWKAIRDFEPDYVFCPPLPMDTVAGVHNDHVTVADAVRRVAYMINVPHAFTPEYPADETKSDPCKVPVIINVYDPYMFGANSFDLAVDVEPAFDTIGDITWCHQSQICEWIPWVGRHSMDVPKSRADWSKILRSRFQRQNRDLGLETDHAVEVFRVTAWGAVPQFEALQRDFPNLIPHANLDALRQQLKHWS